MHSLKLEIDFFVSRMNLLKRINFTIFNTRKNVQIHRVFFLFIKKSFLFHSQKQIEIKLRDNVLIHIMHDKNYFFKDFLFSFEASQKLNAT